MLEEYHSFVYDLLDFVTDKRDATVRCAPDEFYRIPNDLEGSDPSSWHVRQGDKVIDDWEMPEGNAAEIAFPELFELEFEIPADDPLAIIHCGMPLLVLKNEAEKCEYWIPIGSIEDIGVAK